jgi:CVNH domain
VLRKKTNRPRVANFKVYALILMLVPVASSLIGKVPAAHAQGFPDATFGQTCSSARVEAINVSQPEDGVMLTATCPDSTGNPKVSQIDLIEIVNNNGKLEYENGILLLSQDTDSSFLTSCFSPIVTGSRLFAFCKDGSGVPTGADLQLQGITNINGELKYN